MARNKLLVLLLGSMVCMGFAWHLTGSLFAPCSKCVRLDKNFTGKHKSAILKVYGKPSSVFPTKEEMNKGFGINLNTEPLQAWSYKKQKLEVTIKMSDDTVYSIYYLDHKCPYSLRGFGF